MVIKSIDIVFQVYMLMLFTRIICSWAPELQSYRFIQFIAYYTDPYLNIFRKIIPPLGMFDLSPIVAFLCLQFMNNFIQYILR